MTDKLEGQDIDFSQLDLDENEIYEYVAQGMSMRSVAAYAGMHEKQFEQWLFSQPEYQKRFAKARADFEWKNIQALNDSANHPDAPLALKNKNARENLKTLEHWATASKPQVLVQAQPDQRNDFVYGSYTPEDLAGIEADANQESNDDE